MQERSDHATLSTIMKNCPPDPALNAPINSFLNSCYAANVMQFKPPNSVRNTPEIPPIPAPDTPSQKKKNWTTLTDIGRYWSTLVDL